MRYDLTDFEWSVIQPLLPTKQRGVKPHNNRRVLNGIFWVLRAGAPWRDMPERIRLLHDSVQPLQPLEKSRRLGPPDGCHSKGA
jgi:hypothetical protein